MCVHIVGQKQRASQKNIFFLVDNGRVVTEINRWIYDRDENFFFIRTLIIITAALTEK